MSQWLVWGKKPPSHKANKSQSESQNGNSIQISGQLGGNKQMIKRDLKVEFKTSCKQNFESLWFKHQKKSPIKKSMGANELNQLSHNETCQCNWRGLFPETRSYSGKNQEGKVNHRIIKYIVGLVTPYQIIMMTCISRWYKCVSLTWCVET